MARQSFRTKLLINCIFMKGEITQGEAGRIKDILNEIQVKN